MCARNYDVSQHWSCNQIVEKVNIIQVRNQLVDHCSFLRIHQVFLGNNHEDQKSVAKEFDEEVNDARDNYFIQV